MFDLNIPPNVESEAVPSAVRDSVEEFRNADVFGDYYFRSVCVDRRWYCLIIDYIGCEAVLVPILNGLMPYHFLASPYRQLLKCLRHGVPVIPTFPDNLRLVLDREAVERLSGGCHGGGSDHG